MLTNHVCIVMRLFVLHSVVVLKKFAHQKRRFAGITIAPRVQVTSAVILAFVRPLPTGPPALSARVADASRTASSAGSRTMPFMDDVLLWCPEAETKIDDFTECLVS